jgi:hypothetical protein
MSQAPCTLFWPRSGFTPTPGRPMLPVSHGEVGDRHDGGRALAVLGDAEAVVDRAVAAGGVEPRGGAQVSAGTPVSASRSPRANGAARRRTRPVLELVPVAALAHDEGLVDQPSVTMTCASAVSTATLVPGAAAGDAASMWGVRTRSMRRGSMTISFAPCAQPLLHAEAKTGWPSVGLAPITMTTSVCSTESKSCVPAEVPKVWLQAVAGRRMADAGAGVDVVVAEAGADQLLDEEGLLVGAARRGDAADRLRPCFAWMRRNSGGGEGADRLVPGHLAPRIGDLVADHRVQDAVLVGGIAPGEAALDAGMAAVGLAVLPRHHAHQLVAAHLGLEGAADAAIGAGGDDRPLGRADLDHRLLLSVAVGQACTQAPQDTHSEVRKRVGLAPAETRLSKPRPSMVSAKVPCTSSQARTQREQTMHLAGRR